MLKREEQKKTKLIKPAKRKNDAQQHDQSILSAIMWRGMIARPSLTNARWRAKISKNKIAATKRHADEQLRLGGFRRVCNDEHGEAAKCDRGVDPEGPSPPDCVCNDASE
ncbi:hypothetical protein FOXB_16614 [Fusarium oxysporum f. sp. conglutinans Fo5176]|uniref:Uncharacterized protein n=1 Tax=Fusarium oxysporum (strain Fo5176) TaxID=660025 RepID=F9GD80_FUSOF|nr:hypothetical protein FOXB_16614 [Fusarium oxysporum f. sp. conglutinans Fo5176]